MECAHAILGPRIQIVTVFHPHGANDRAPAQAAALAGGAGVSQLGGGYADRDESAQEAAKLKEQMVGVIKQKPVNSTRAVQAWLREEQS